MSDPAFSLANRIALVTGGSRGIGQAIAAALARQGADVAVCSRNEADLDKTASEVRRRERRVFCFEMDVRRPEQIREGINAVSRELGPIDILVNNAGTNVALPAAEVTQDSWSTIYETNVRGGFFAAQAVFPSMRERGYGRVVFIASQAGIRAIANQSVYCSSKAAAIQLTRCLAVEWGRYGITANAVAPTYVRTAMTEKRLNDPEFMRFVMEKIPAGKVATPEDVAEAVVYLASDDAGMVNGSVLSVDGGWTAW